MLTGLSPSLAGLSRPLQLRQAGSGWVLNLTSHPVRRWTVRFGLFPFRSPLLRESLLISLPPLTKMFPFRGFLLEACASSSIGYYPIDGSPIRVSPALRQHAPPRGVSPLAA